MRWFFTKLAVWYLRDKVNGVVLNTRADEAPVDFSGWIYGDGWYLDFLSSANGRYQKFEKGETDVVGYCRTKMTSV